MPPLGIAVERLSDAVKRYKYKLHFVHFESLTANPAETMAEVWKYLGLEFNGHDFDNVEQYTKEHELGWPYGDHEIRGKVEPIAPDWNETLGRPLADQVAQTFRWIKEL